ncbi:hypothetical protein V1J52_15770 [Streptomyces sp. TRM 70351]|uniref:hypothetical protein n=1 Tax=Streptomyces sp. TRM 70351 TaxID=3116552 RepID=UPI002E7B787F|nr:hypothetical protein [Streptomyces sp. TRM 70351]MEE1929624.1 hypothetical protein [Streptomyces sp. TRM 70351]
MPDSSAPPTARVVADLRGFLDGAAERGRGALWRLAEPERGLDANCVRLAPGAEVAEHVENTVDVLLLVLSGDGHLTGGGGRLALSAHTVAWLPRGARRSLRAGADGLLCLTVHTRRPGLTITRAAPGVPERAEDGEGGEEACLLHRVCPGCGRLSGNASARYCDRCGHALEG